MVTFFSCPFASFVVICLLPFALTLLYSPFILVSAGPLMRWKITGADASTGRDVGFEVPANSRQEPEKFWTM